MEELERLLSLIIPPPSTDLTETMVGGPRCRPRKPRAVAEMEVRGWLERGQIAPEQMQIAHLRSKKKRAAEESHLFGRSMRT